MRTAPEASSKTSASPQGEAGGEPRSALVAGATGLVGGFLLDTLLEDDLYREVRVLVRRGHDRRHPKLSARVVDYDRLEESAEALGADDVYCCLGTTLEKAGSRAAFRKVDHDYVAALARLSRSAGARRFFLVSSVGADPSASYFYLRVKGEAEESVAACGFPELHVFRPSLLEGPRREDRPGERAAIVAARLFGWLLVGPLRRYRPIHVRALAAAMVEAARAGGGGRRVYAYGEIVRLAGEAAARSPQPERSPGAA